jgi:hypothetical protein
MNTARESSSLAILLERRLDGMPRLRAARGEIESWNDLEPAAALDRGKTLLRDMLAGGFMTELVNFELDHMLRFTSYVPPGRLGVAPLLSAGGWELAVATGAALLAGGTPKLSSYERDVVYAVAGGSPVPCTRHRFAGVSDWEIFDRTGRAVPLEPFTLQVGEVFALDSGSETFEPFRTADTTVLTLESPLRRAFVWEFDRVTLEPSRFVIADLEATRVGYTPELLAKLQSRESIPILEELATHPRHFVRWNAIKALCSLDPEVGLRVLTAARDDIHPHVRRAAEASLRLFAAQEVA